MSALTTDCPQYRWPAEMLVNPAYRPVRRTIIRDTFAQLNGAPRLFHQSKLLNNKNVLSFWNVTPCAELVKFDQCGIICSMTSFVHWKIISASRLLNNYIKTFEYFLQYSHTFIKGHRLSKQTCLIFLKQS